MISTIEKVLFLKGVPLFQGIAGEELAHIAQIAEETEVLSETAVFREGEPGDAMYLIVHGEVRVHTRSQELARLGARQCFGEMAILDSEPRSAHVTALTDLSLLRIGREDFHEIMTEKPEIGLGIIAVLTARLREANRRGGAPEVQSD